MRRAFAIACAAAVIGGCASGPPGRTTATGPTQAERITMLEQRVQRLDNLAESGQLIELLQRVEALQAELRELRGDVERLGHDGESLNRRQRELYLDLDRRLQNLESGNRPSGGAAAAVTPPLALPEAVAPAQVAQAVGGGDERRAYDGAYRLLLDGRYPVAIDAFRQYLGAHPDGQFAGNAQYWLGEAYFVTRDFPNALTEFRKVLERYPQSPKAADAMLKIGYTQYELQQWDDARRALSEAVQRAPGTTVAQLAQRRLDRMRQEGR